MFDIRERLCDPMSAQYLRTTAYSTYCNDRFVPERNINLMPAEFKRMVCSCRDRQSRLVRKDNMESLLSVCSSCKKPESYYLYRCTMCESLFIHDFRAVFCYQDPCCWNCVTPADACDGHNYCEYYWRPDQWIAPVLPKPRVFTAEELADVFDF